MRSAFDRNGGEGWGHSAFWTFCRISKLKTGRNYNNK